MTFIKRILLFFLLVVTAVFLLNIVGYRLNQKINGKNITREQAEDFAVSQQVLVQLISRNISSISLHSAFSSDQLLEQQTRLDSTLNIFRTTNDSLGKLLSLYPDFTPVLSLFTESQPQYWKVVETSEKLLSHRGNLALSQSELAGMRAGEMAFLAKMSNISETLKTMQGKFDKSLNQTSALMKLSLIVTIVFLSALVVFPMYRQLRKHVAQLTDSLSEIKKSESLLRTIVDASPDYIFIQDVNNRFQMVNRSICQETGLTPDEFMGKNAIDLGMPEDFVKGNPKLGINGSWNDNAEVVSGGKPKHIPEEKIAFAGVEKIVTTTKVPLKDGSGKVWGILGFLHDITNRFEAEEKLRQSEERYRQIFSNNPLPMWVIDNESGRFMEVNKTAEQQYGYSSEEFLSMTVFDIRPESDREKLKKVIEHSQNNRTNFFGIWTHRKKNGELIKVDVVSHSFNFKGRPAKLVMAHDVTENYRLMNELAEARVERQKAIAKASIRVQEQERSEIGRELHDNVNQILTSVKLQIEYSQYSNVFRQEFMSKSVSLLQSAIEEIRRLSRSLVPPVLRDTCLVSSIEDMVQMLKTTSSINFDFRHNNPAPELIEDDLKLTVYRILQEQTTNILRHSGAGNVRIQLTLSGGILRLKVTDDGIGFDAKQQVKGVGLRNIFNRVEIFHGDVKLISSPGNGCELEVSFDLEAANARGRTEETGLPLTP